MEEREAREQKALAHDIFAGWNQEYGPRFPDFARNEYEETYRSRGAQHILPTPFGLEMARLLREYLGER